MLTTRIPRMKHGAVGGFTLVELLVAMVLSLVVSFAAISFFLSLSRANSDDLKTTRLTQELRAIAEVVGREVRRARYVADPIANVTKANAAPPPEVNDGVTINANGNCLSLRYDLPPTEGGTQVQRAIYLDTTNNRVLLTTGAACSGGTVISTPQVVVTALSFDNDMTAPYDGSAVVGNFVRIRVGGRLASATGDLASLTRTFQQDIYIRSGEVD